MPIEATTPTVLSATYDKWAVQFRTNGFPSARVGAATPDTVSCTVVMQRSRIRDDGVWEASPLPGDLVEFTVPDLYALAAAKPETVGVALQSMLVAIAGEAAERGVL